MNKDALENLLANAANISIEEAQNILSEYQNFDEPLKNTLNEPIARYMRPMQFQFSAFNKNAIISLVDSSRSSQSVINEVLETTGLTTKFLAEDIFEITPKTLFKYRSSSINLPSYIKERAAELLQLYASAFEIFLDAAAFNAWLFKASVGLNGVVPSSLLKTSAGISLIYEELMRIAYGATA